MEPTAVWTDFLGIPVLHARAYTKIFVYTAVHAYDIRVIISVARKRRDAWIAIAHIYLIYTPIRPALRYTAA